MIDLFSRAGSAASGFLVDRFRGGYECVLSLDSDIAAISTLATNFGGEDSAELIDNMIRGNRLKNNKDLPLELAV
jgi:DNA (cytosine-5)-methyltransferase 1